MSDTGTNGDFDPSKLDPALLATFPALTPPSGVEPNFNNPRSIAYQCQVAVYVLLPIMLVHVVLRIYTRLQVKNSLGIDDYSCAVSSLMMTAYCSIILRSPHQWDVRLIDLTESFVKMSTIQFIMYSFTATFIKLSILLLYRRLFWIRDSARYMICIGMVVTALFYLACFISSLIHCVPRHGEGWLSQESKQRCAQPELEVSVVQGVFGVISDFYLLLIPMLQVTRLRVTTSQKIGLAGLFLTGLLACICSVTLCIYRFRQRGTDDFTYMSVPVYTFAVAELNVGIICSCMPVIFVVVKSFSKKVTSTIRGRSSGSRSGELPTDGVPPNCSSEAKPLKPLPAVPRGHLSTLMSFIRSGRRNNTEAGSLVNGDLILTNMSDFDPRKDTYHAHIQSIEDRA
ncbi:hypothetical protein DPSP01_006160 [Paraphaeosphaeria sporulosa]